MSKIIFITGGARSGKSSFAEQMAGELSESVGYLATAEALDPEMEDRIRLHRERRPAHWKTVEEPFDLARGVSRLFVESDVVILDCLTLWVSNLIHRYASGVEETAKAYLKKVFDLNTASGDKILILVSNEVGMGIIPELPINRVFSDVLGRVNQFVAAQADEVYFMVSGIPMKLNSEKVNR